MNDREVWSTMERQALRERDERVLGGRAVPGDGMDGVVTLLEALRSPADDVELSGSEALFEQFVATVRHTTASSTDTATPAASRRRKVIPLLTGKVVVIGVVTVFSAGAAAAATGVLPASIQSTVDDALGRIGIDRGDGDDEVAPVISSTGSDDAVTGTSGAEASPVIVEPARSSAEIDELCRHRAVGDPSFDESARVRLEAAASDARATVDELCATVAGGTVPATTVVPVVDATVVTAPPATTGSSPRDTAPGRSGDPGRPDSPGNSGSTPADTAPGRPDDPGRPTSPGKSGDAGPPADDGTPGNGNGNGNGNGDGAP